MTQNRVLGAVIAAAALAGLTPSLNAPSSAQQVKASTLGGAPQVPGTTLAQVLQQIASQSESSRWSWWQPTYPRRGWTVAEGKRRARKARNRLRAKGQHKRAVR